MVDRPCKERKYNKQHTFEPNTQLHSHTFNLCVNTIVMPTTYDCAFVLETLLVRARRAEWEAIAIATKRSYNQNQSAVYYPQRAMCFL